MRIYVTISCLSVFVRIRGNYAVTHSFTQYCEIRKKIEKFSKFNRRISLKWS